MFNPISILTGNLGTKILIGGAVAIGAYFLISSASSKPTPALNGAKSRTKTTGRKKSAVVSL